MDLQTLRERQAWTLDQKIYHTIETVDTFVQKMKGCVYVAFSGGKDSTVLFDICRKVNPDIKGIFVNTGCEYSDIVRFVNQQIRGGVEHPNYTSKTIS